MIKESNAMLWTEDRKKIWNNGGSGIWNYYQVENDFFNWFLAKDLH